MYRILLAGVAFVVIGLNGAISGLWNDRFTVYHDAEIAAAVEKLHRVPLTIGKWDGRDIVEDKKVYPEEIVGPHIVRRYVDRYSGMALAVFLTCGASRPMWSGHLPTDCYPSAGYTQAGPPRKWSLPADAAPPGTFRAVTFNMEPVHLRAFWSWSGDGSWQTPDYPHRAFARYPFLYKLYVTRPMLKADEPLESDPAGEFLRAFVPELKKSLF